MTTRREFVAAVGATGAAAIGGRAVGAVQPEPLPVAGKKAFRLQYAPHFGMFEAQAGKDPVEQLKFMADQGFAALEDNGMTGRSTEEQERIAKEMSRLKMTMGVFVASPGTSWGPNYVTGKAEGRDKFLADCRGAVEIAKRVNAKWMTVVPGTVEPRLEFDYQTANVIDALRRAAEIFEPHGLVMVLEPLNPWRDHPGMFLSKIPQAYMICKAVKGPSCKILFDIYHQQITEGNLIPNMEKAWDEIAYFQTGDNPGRNEPTTGEINYRNIFKYVHGKGYKGVLGMEHGNSKPGKDGELAVIEAYRQCDAF